MRAVTGPLTNAQQAWAFWERYVWPRIKPDLIAGRRLRITVREDTRTLDQNAKFHAMCDDIAKSGVQWAGKPRTAAQWKVLLVSGHAVVTNEDTDIVPGLEGEFINLRESTALMTVRRGASLIEYTLSFMADKGIPMYEDEEAAA